MLATPGPLPAGPEWYFEVKWDGMRLLADLSAERGLRLTSRTGRDVTAHFPELAELAALAPDVLLDGEVVQLVGGRPSFAALSERFHRVPTPAEVAATPVVYMVFDVLRLYGVPLLSRTQQERRDTLDRLAFDELVRVLISPAYDDGEALLAATQRQGLEGVVAKRRDGVYRPGQRARSWVKVAHRRTQDCLVGGWRTEKDHPSRIGALLLGVPGDGGLKFAGRVGSGVAGDVTQRRLRAGLVERAESPFTETLPKLDATGAHWCEPTLTVEISHTGWTDGHRLRHPVLQRLRLDL